jgi:Tfp pilus assembly protein PilF
MMQRRPAIAIGLIVISLAACATGSRNPYADIAPPLRRHPLRAERLTFEAIELIESDPNGAAALLKSALVEDLYYGPAHNNLGVVQLRQGRLYEAANEFEWARKLMPGHPDPRLNLALVLERAGRVDEALDTYGTALEVYPGHLPTIQAMTRCQLRHHRSDDRISTHLEQIALRGETEEWRRWARGKLIETGR